MSWSNHEKAAETPSSKQPTNRPPDLTTGRQNGHSKFRSGGRERTSENGRTNERTNERTNDAANERADERKARKAEGGAEVFTLSGDHFPISNATGAVVESWMGTPWGQNAESSGGLRPCCSDGRQVSGLVTTKRLLEKHSLPRGIEGPLCLRRVQGVGRASTPILVSMSYTFWLIIVASSGLRAVSRTLSAPTNDKVIASSSAKNREIPKLRDS